VAHDHVGALELPVNTTDLPVGDPLLTILGNFMQAAIRAACGRAWNSIGGNTDVCGRVETNNPKDNTFVTAGLPALFIFRDAESFTEEWIADELCELKSNITALWVLPLAAQYWKAVRSPFVQALHGAVGRAFRDDYVKGYRKPREADPYALMYGSSLTDWANLMRQIYTVKVKPTVLEIGMSEDLPTKRFPAVEFTIPISEQETLFEENAPNVRSKLDAAVAANAAITVDTIAEPEAAQIHWDVP